MNNTIYIDKSSSNPDTYSSISEALDYILDFPEGYPVTISIAPGIYHEKLEVLRSDLTIIGSGKTPSDTIITYDDYAFDQMSDGTKRGTFRSYSVFIDANRVHVKNLTIENASGDENTHGQAIALYAEGDQLLFENVRLLGRQDTLFTGPLPPKELQPNGFIGPKQFAKRINGLQIYKDCYICGNVDFIFGSSTAYFENCMIESLAHNPDKQAIQGYVTAPSTPEGQEYGYVFQNCQFISSECADGTCYLSRPWRDFAKAVFLNCKLGSHIHPDMFHDWNKPNAREHVLYATYQNYKSAGSGESIFTIPQADFARELSDEEAKHYHINEVHS